MLSHWRAGNAAACSRNALSEALSPGSRTNAPAAARESGDPPSSDGAVLELEGTSTLPSWRAFARALLGRSRRVPGLGGVLRAAGSGTSRREVPAVTRAGPLCSHAHARRAGATGASKVNAFGALPVALHRPTALRVPREAGGETLLTRGRARVSLRRARVFGRRLRASVPSIEDTPKTREPAGPFTRASRQRVFGARDAGAAVRRPGGSGSRSVRER